MSDLERHYEQRGSAAAPSRCPVCWDDVRKYWPIENGLPGLTCASAGLSHFEWNPDPAIKVDAERVTVTTPDGRTDVIADKLPYVKLLTTPHSQPQVEGDVDPPFARPVHGGFRVTDRRSSHRVLHRPGCPAMNYSGPCECAVVEAEVLGVDWRTVVAARLGGNAGRLAALHAPIKARWGSECHGCDAGAHAEESADWPCETAELALEMMGLTESDIAPSKE